jgi:hypothetical protein
MYSSCFRLYNRKACGHKLAKEWGKTIEFPYKVSTCALMYNRQHPHLYYGGHICYPANFLTRRAALRTNSIGQQPAHKGKGWGGGQST